LPPLFTLESAASDVVRQITPMVVPGTQPKLAYQTVKSGKVAVIRSEIRPANSNIPALVSLGYLGVKGSKLAVVTFTAPLSVETHIRSIADQSIDTFRFEP